MYEKLISVFVKFLFDMPWIPLLKVRGVEQIINDAGYKHI